MPTAFITDPLFKQHDPGWQHPESPARIDAVVQALHQTGLRDLMLGLTPRIATEAQLAWCHDPAYIEQVRHEIQSGVSVISTGDTQVSYRSFEVAQYATGAVFRAVDAVCGGEARNAFCAIRPPGHHATARRGMGFCLFNHVALGARYAQHTHGLKRILIIDWDVHHGNGTQDLFYEDAQVFYCSTHQAPLYPFTGEEHETGAGEGVGTTLNIALPAGTDGATLIEALRHRLEPRLADFKPELILLSAGFDILAQDPIGQFRVTTDDIAPLTDMVMQWAATYCGQRLVSVLEGGYHLAALGEAATVHAHQLLHGQRDSG